MPPSPINRKPATGAPSATTTSAASPSPSTSKSNPSSDLLTAAKAVLPENHPPRGGTIQTGMDRMRDISSRWDNLRGAILAYEANHTLEGLKKPKGKEGAAAIAKPGPQMTHTPGPWTYDDGGPGHRYITADVDGPGGKWKHIATVDLNQGASAPTSRGENDANARLIAASPDFLEVCELLTAWNNDHSGDGVTLEAICNRAAAAITTAKAAGEVRP